MSEREYHKAMAEAASEAIKDGAEILRLGTVQSPSRSVQPKPLKRERMLGDLLREAAQRGLGQH